ncbi:MAG: hypothetical protein U0074_05525 [Kouleothrix sp.]
MTATRCIDAAPDVSYPSLSVVAFLVEQYSFSAFRTFLDVITARSGGYRSALERTPQHLARRA